VIHPTAEVSPKAVIGPGARVWHQAQVREGAVIGEGSIVGKGAYIDFDVKVGKNCKIQNGAFLYHGLTVEDGVFIGPQACITNDRIPRAISPDGNIKGNDDWTVGPVLIRYGASIGACAVILPDITIGRFALVAAGSVVTRSVPDHALVVGTPARQVGYVCRCARRLNKTESGWHCQVCDWSYQPSEP
jgi:UDP-2-acetamido-3-amino-2,3-dideoxy-glucuronate N-acetyltransferase